MARHAACRAAARVQPALVAPVCCGATEGLASVTSSAPGTGAGMSCRLVPMLGRELTAGSG